MRRRPWRANSRRAMWSSARWRPARSRRSGRRCASRSCRRRWTVCVRRSRHSSSRAARATWPSHTRGATQPRACGDASAVRGSRAERRRAVRRRRCCWSAHWSCGTRSGCCLVLCTPSAHRHCTPSAVRSSLSSRAHRNCSSGSFLSGRRQRSPRRPRRARCNCTRPSLHCTSRPWQTIRRLRPKVVLVLTCEGLKLRVRGCRHARRHHAAAGTVPAAP
mmetsp:Transcript_61918/g.170152  ORF Transcript_61918/g.170152 Transcript_61918/m.170152 type:complete len:219 (+) Transcript_61918:982-1638(+)